MLSVLEELSPSRCRLLIICGRNRTSILAISRPFDNNDCSSTLPDQSGGPVSGGISSAEDNMLSAGIIALVPIKTILLPRVKLGEAEIPHTALLDRETHKQLFTASTSLGVLHAA
jgi:hypothetical protein